jgi:hypothetical protein
MPSGTASSPGTIAWSLRAASPKAQVEGKLSGQASAKALAWPLSAAVRVAAAEMPDRQAHASAEAAPGPAAEIPARSFQAAQSVAPSALPAPSARLAVAVLPRAAGHAGVAPQAVRDAAGAPQQAAEVLVGAAVPRPEAAVPVGAEVAALRPEAAARAGVAEAARQQEAAAPGARAVLRRAVLPSAVPWVFRRDQPPPWPAPRPAARFARANERRRIALP